MIIVRDERYICIEIKWKIKKLLLLYFLYYKVLGWEDYSKKWKWIFSHQYLYNKLTE